MIGRQLSHFEILDRLGAGGMGEVYLARDRKLERNVALKLLPTEVARDQGHLRRLQREARALAALDHPNIVTVFSIEEAEDVHFLTMAHVDGPTLEEVVPADGLPIAELLRLAVPMADALQAAHERGIVHRDLKPSNIMIDSSGRLRILDFGLAKKWMSVEADLHTDIDTVTMTAHGALVGTLPYMSPEQAEGKPATTRSDIFSTGVVLYQMATGSRPFQGDTPTAVLSSIFTKEPPRLSTLRPQLPERLSGIVERCLEKDPEARYPTAEELRNDLRNLEQDVDSGWSQPAPSRGDWWKRPARPALLALVTALLIGGAVALWSGLHEPTPSEPSPETAAGVVQSVDSLAVLPLRNHTGDPQQRYFVDGMTEALISNLSQIESLKVVAPSSAMRYRDSDKPLAEIGRELGVDALVEGTVLREGDRVAVTASLVEAPTERTLWSQRYEQDLTSILALQSEMARAISAEVHITLTPQEKRLLTTTREVDPQAYEAYLKGMQHWNELTDSDLKTALGYFEQALHHDPTYAPAHAGIARVWLGRQQMGFAAPTEATPKARKAATRALELDPTVADAHSALAMLAAWGEWSWQMASDEFERALELRPNDPHALAYYSHVLLLRGRHDEALAHAEKALELDPLNPLHRTLHGIVLTFLGRHEEALRSNRETLEIVPGHPVGLHIEWMARLQQGELEPALEAARSLFALAGHTEIAAALEPGDGRGYRQVMQRAAAVLDEWPRAEYCPAMLAILVYVGAGDREGALAWVRRGLEIRDPSLPYVAVAPALAELRDEPTFREAVRIMGLDPE